LLDSTVIVHEDIQSIFDCLGTEISSLADKLCERNQKFMPVSVPLRMDLMKKQICITCCVELYLTVVFLTI